MMVILALILSQSNQAALAESAPTTTATPVEKMLMSKGVTIVSKFDSVVPGLKSILAKSANGQKQLFYTDPAGKYLIAGQVFNQQGESLTEQDLSRVAVNEQPIVTDQGARLKSFSKAESAAWIQDGKAGKLVYVIFDPVCPVCHDFYVNTRQAVVNGHLQIRWLPVAILGDRKNSWNLIETLFQSADTETSMRQMAYNQLQPAKSASDETVKKLSQNLLILRDLQSRRVPTVLFKDSNGQVEVFDGMTDSRMRGILSNQ